MDIDYTPRVTDGEVGLRHLAFYKSKLKLHEVTEMTRPACE